MSSVYFIQADRGGPIKIGVAKDVEARLRDLQVGNPFELRVVGQIPNAGQALERRLHSLLERHRIRGEWFWPHPEVLHVADRLCNQEIRARLDRIEERLGGVDWERSVVDLTDLGRRTAAIEDEIVRRVDYDEAAESVLTALDQIKGMAA